MSSNGIGSERAIQNKITWSYIDWVTYNKAICLSIYILDLWTMINIHSPLTHTPCFQNIHSFVEASPNFRKSSSFRIQKASLSFLPLSHCYLPKRAVRWEMKSHMWALRMRRCSLISWELKFIAWKPAFQSWLCHSLTVQTWTGDVFSLSFFLCPWNDSSIGHWLVSLSRWVKITITTATKLTSLRC